MHIYTSKMLIYNLGSKVCFKACLKLLEVGYQSTNKGLKVRTMVLTTFRIYVDALGNFVSYVIVAVRRDGSIPYREFRLHHFLLLKGMDHYPRGDA